MPIVGITLAAFCGSVWLLISRRTEIRAAFNQAFRDNQWLFRIVGITIFVWFFLTSARSVKHDQQIWKFTGKGGQTVVTETEAQYQMWLNVRWDSLGVLLGGFVAAYVSGSILSAQRLLRELKPS